MERKLQHQIAFFLTGRRDDSQLHPMDANCRPAIFAQYGDLSALRYDFPLVLHVDGTPERAVQSLSKLVDEAVAALSESPERDRIARHGYRLEHELRRELTANGPGEFATLWDAAAHRLSGEGEGTIKDSAKRLWSIFHASGELVDADSALPSRVVRHAWNSVQANKAKAFQNRAERLLMKLRDILAAEMIGSKIGRTPEKLKAGVGSSFEGAFDFDKMSEILVESKPTVELSDMRRMRIRVLIDVLERQRFYSIGAENARPYSFEFERFSDALGAYQDRHEESVELLKTLAVADLEASGEYRESVHDVLFESFGANGLDSAELAALPDYLVCANTRTLDASETECLVELLAAGIPIKALVQVDDVLEPSVVAEGHVALGLHARQFVDTAVGLTDVFVFQGSASCIYQKKDSLLRGLTFEGPALFNVFSGSNEHTSGIPPYLVAAAATEARAFPSLVYDPSAGSDWASRLSVEDNPAPDEDWPAYVLAYEDGSLQSQSDRQSFTLADFMAMDDRFSRHYAIVPKADWSDSMVPVPAAFQTDVKGLPNQVPYVLLVNEDGQLLRAILDERSLREVRRCRNMWHSLQELGGIHNSHAERLLAQERKAHAAVEALPVDDSGVQEAVSAVATQADSAALSSEQAVEESHGDDPYIETARCTTCNECTQVNNKMFAYNENKQAYIADPDAGTFRQLVEAAEGCQVSIIHPGKPRNPKEPGIDDLIKRAAAFN